MLNLPANNNTFRRSFLGGAGTIEVQSDDWKAIVGTDPFSPSNSRVARVALSGKAPALKLGAADSVALELKGSAGIGSQVQLFWPQDRPRTADIHGLQLGGDRLVARLSLDGKADASASGGFPAGPLSARFGVEAGGQLGYARVKSYAAATGARSLLADLFGGVRLPQQVTTAEEIPEDGEVLITRMAGYLKLTAQVSYGYQMTGSQDLPLGALPTKFTYDLRAVAALSAGYRIAGDFELEAHRGSRPGFARYIVRKSRDSEFSFGADFGFTAKLDFKGLPDSADVFLSRLLGSDVERLLGILRQAQEYTSLEELEKKAGKLAAAAAHDLAKPLIGAALSNANLRDFLNKVLAAADAYNSFDARVLHLYEDFVGRVPHLDMIVSGLKEVTDPDNLRSVKDSEAWAVVRRLAGDRQLDILVNPDEFAKVHALLVQTDKLINGEAEKKIRDTIAELKSGFALDPLFKKLEGIKDAKSLAKVADLKLQGLVERLVGIPFDEIAKTEPAKRLAEIHTAIAQVNGFRDKYYARLRGLAHQSLRASLSLAYNQSSSSKALIDVEIDVSVPEGQRLAKRAVMGDFADVLAEYGSPHVVLRQGQLTHSSTSSTQLQLNVIGYQFKGITTLLQNVDEALEPHEGGLLHIYTTTTSLEQRRESKSELTMSTFLLTTVAEALQRTGNSDQLVRTLPRMSVEYRLIESDTKTDPSELTAILDFAETVGLVPSARAYSDQLRREFPAGLGTVKAQYIVRYGEKEAEYAFLIADNATRDNMRAIARRAIRGYIAAAFTNRSEVSWLPRLGFAYLDDRWYNLKVRIGNSSAFVNENITAVLPSWFTRSAAMSVALTPEMKQALFTLYANEDSYLQRLVAFDRAIDGLRDGTEPLSSDELNKLARSFVSAAKKTDWGRDNTFFIAFDSLVREGSAGKVKRKSALLLEITPPGTDEPITKYLTECATAEEEPLVMAAGEAEVARAAGSA